MNVEITKDKRDKNTKGYLFMEERYYIKIGNCYVDFIGVQQDIKMRSDYHKAAPFLTERMAKRKALEKRIASFKIVKKLI